MEKKKLKKRKPYTATCPNCGGMVKELGSKNSGSYGGIGMSITVYGCIKCDLRMFMVYKRRKTNVEQD